MTTTKKRMAQKIILDMGIGPEGRLGGGAEVLGQRAERLWAVRGSMVESSSSAEQFTPTAIVSAIVGVL